MLDHKSHEVTISLEHLWRGRRRWNVVGCIPDVLCLVFAGLGCVEPVSIRQTHYDLNSVASHLGKGSVGNWIYGVFAFLLFDVAPLQSGPIPLSRAEPLYSDIPMHRPQPIAEHSIGEKSVESGGNSHRSAPRNECDVLTFFVNRPHSSQSEVVIDMESSQSKTRGTLSLSLNVGKVHHGNPVTDDPNLLENRPAPEGETQDFTFLGWRLVLGLVDGIPMPGIAANADRQLGGHALSVLPRDKDDFSDLRLLGKIKPNPFRLDVSSGLPSAAPGCLRIAIN